jgi:hypothetical protein
MITKFDESMITDDMIKAAKMVFECMAIAETIRPIVEGYQKEILAYEKYPYSDKAAARREKDACDWIDNPDHTYLMSDNDFAHYMKRTREEQDKAGLKTESPEHCPLLVADHNVVLAKNVLIDAMAELTGINLDSLGSMVHYNKYIELTLKLLAPFVKK